ncbi:MAG: hypothetical protein A2600_09935 [Candidatus Lambdaproteobacteria bacterium RIFOXYD1_FULL_56_27]|uniref:Conjugal transfer protein TraH n=1 Tax=Candidatus Lambdaproteobacteria bacterium RIFOXYD2_FULL_56_26 TaxID=1817773 RepID=A0A1F6GU25_9PROT|nr:MAG: hypothetical protein A2557_11755 [Candidatus Lambdaproteobacteria bacterium RIFOXYD2_FULL_56_26]OGH07399.1 MAG: hypothetical protein A2600_09935 [Candidatus Lambdaproteobacteria bacterium RIFOXYD1_FULL_56_27]
MSSKSLWLFLGLMVLAPASLLAANFLQHWMDQVDQSSTTQPGYYQGSQYGYYNGGSVSRRLQMKTTPLFTAQRPSISVGCGGIDMFWGSFGMVDPQYLQTRVQKILQAAPYAAFDLAMKVLCESCAGTIKDIDAALDRLNSLQLNECAASKALVATIASPMAPNNEAIANDINSFKVSTGAQGTWRGATEKLDANGGQITTAEVDELIAGCAQDVKDIFGQSGSVLERVGLKLGYPTEHLDAVRAMFGDIIVIKNNGYVASYTPPCPDAEIPDLGKFVTGGGVTQPLIGGVPTCQPMPTNSNQTLEAKMTQMLTSMKDSMAVKGDLAPSDRAAMRTSALPLQLLMKISLKTKTDDGMIAEFGALVAKEKVYLMLKDLTLVANQAFNTATQAAGLAVGRKPSNGSTCQVMVMGPAIAGFDKLHDSTQKASAAIHQQYQQAMKQSVDSLARLEKVRQQDESYGKEVKQAFKQSKNQ